MHDTAKYLIHADVTADGVVERSDVVGAIFGQTEGLLGEDLELPGLQDSSRLGRIDVEIESESGQSFGTVTIASGLDRVETAILAAALETIDRVGPCRASISVASIEDVRAAKRRQVVERAKELLGESFEGSMLTSEEIVEEVRRAVRVEDITEYEGLPAGPRAADSDAVIVVEGRADVRTLLRYGVKNAIAVEGTNVPEAVADLTRGRTVTAFLDGDRGGDLILKELAQVGDVDYVALAPPGRSVEEMDHSEVMAVLREKVPYEAVADADSPHEVAATDGSSRPAPPGVGTEPVDAGTERPVEPEPDAGSSDEATAGGEADTGSGPEIRGVGTAAGEAVASESGDGEATGDEEAAPAGPESVPVHVREIVAGETGLVRLLDGDAATLEEGPVEEAFERIRGSEPIPVTAVLDGELTQRVLDVCAQRGVEQAVARSTGELVKQPASVRVLTADQLIQS